jgi:hypothetical protein
MKKEKAEFGKGLVICLVKFAEHAMYISHFLKMNEQMSEKDKENPSYWNEGQAVSMWANGATDHLYEIEVPKGKEWDSIRRKVKRLQNKGLDMGHGSGVFSDKFTKKDADDLVRLTIEIAMMIDRKIGLKPDSGSF